MKKFIALLLGADNWQEMQSNGLKLALLVPAVRWIDWVAVGVTGSLVMWLKHYGFSDMAIFLVLWGGSIAYSGIVVFINDTTKTDILLMGALRRMINVLIAKSRGWGYTIEIALVIRLVLWDGPDNFILFVRERLATRKQNIIALVLAAVCRWLFGRLSISLGIRCFSEVTTFENVGVTSLLIFLLIQLILSKELF